MAAPGPAFTRGHGRGTGHPHPGTQQAHRPQAARPQAARRLVRARLQPTATGGTLDPATINALTWLERASLPIQKRQDPQVIRRTLAALTLRLDGTRAAANTIARKQAVFHNALGYAVELGLLPVNPLDRVNRTAPHAGRAVNPQTVGSPAQVQAILAQVADIRRELVAFFGCLYYAALRPEEAVALRRSDIILPPHG